jgi:drug/metabolite transporter (DMT)-like permease
MGATQALSMGLLYGGQARVPSALASVLMSLTPLFVVVIARRWLAEPTRARTLVASASGLIGVLLVSGARSADGLDGVGIALVVAAALASAVSKTVGKAIADLPVAVLLRDLGVVVATSALAVSLASERAASWTFEPIEILAAIYLGAVPSTAANAVYFLVLREVEVSRLSYLQVVSATIGLASGVLVAGERLAGSAALGVALVLAGAAFHAARRAPPAAVRE